jgi:hypothetical protein
MDQDKEINITSRKGQKPSPASPASPARCASRPSKAAPQPWELPCETGATVKTINEPPLRRRTALLLHPLHPFHPFFGSADPR